MHLANWPCKGTSAIRDCSATATFQFIRNERMRCQVKKIDTYSLGNLEKNGEE